MYAEQTTRPSRFVGSFVKTANTKVKRKQARNRTTNGASRNSTNAAVHACKECGRWFRHRPNLRAHTLMHLGARPHGCSICGRSFRQKAHMMRHLRVHTGERPYECANCTWKFPDAGSLKTHRKAKHDGEGQAFQCIESRTRESDLLHAQNAKEPLRIEAIATAIRISVEPSQRHAMFRHELAAQKFGVQLPAEQGPRQKLCTGNLKICNEAE
eukprot:jgi/Bigna1/74062/fgenesh1_pg.27_\